MGNEENGEFQISLLSGWWAVFTEIKEIGKKTFWEESLEFSLRCKFGVKSESHSVVSNSLGPHGLYSPWNSPGQDTQGSNPGLPHCRQILYQLSHKGSLRILEWVAYPFSSGSNWGLLHCSVAIALNKVFFVHLTLSRKFFL